MSNPAYPLAIADALDGAIHVGIILDGLPRGRQTITEIDVDGEMVGIARLDLQGLMLELTSLRVLLDRLRIDASDEAVEGWTVQPKSKWAECKAKGKYRVHRHADAWMARHERWGFHSTAHTEEEAMRRASYEAKHPGKPDSSPEAT